MGRGRFSQLWHGGNKRTEVHDAAHMFHRKQGLGAMNTALLAHQLRTLLLPKKQFSGREIKTTGAIKNQRTQQQKQRKWATEDDTNDTIYHEHGINIVVLRNRKPFPPIPYDTDHHRRSPKSAAVSLLGRLTIFDRDYSRQTSRQQRYLHLCERRRDHARDSSPRVRGDD